MLKPYLSPDLIEAGLDEAGRGSYAGPVYAAAVILPKDFYHPLLNDSKLVKEKERYLLREVIEKESIAFAVASMDIVVIDSINILQATFKAMHQAIEELSINPDCLLVDGNHFKRYGQLPHTCIIKGDGKYMAIAAASILAKTYRDDHMHELHLRFPQYGWNTNKGYGTAYHREAIAQFGLCCHHRKSYNIHPAAAPVF